ncbi:hypothetical protein RWE87_13565 [Sinorhizobium meliloti]|uniref:hypothetical protein n=1 Tax=Rhizobium meliloti TaxID=382 RepID=UPI00299D83C5|nr:hypothetical protein [Sinorhizobium meliloti]
MQQPKPVAGFDGYMSPKDILDYPTLPDETVVVAHWNGKSWPDGARSIMYLTGKKNALGLRFIWNHSDVNGMKFETKDQAYGWLIQNDIYAHRSAVTTIGELKALVGYPIGPWRRKP